MSVHHSDSDNSCVPIVIKFLYGSVKIEERFITMLDGWKCYQSRRLVKDDNGETVEVGEWSETGRILPGSA